MLDIDIYSTIHSLFLFCWSQFPFDFTRCEDCIEVYTLKFLVQNDEMQGQAETGGSANSKVLEAPVLLDFDTEIGKKHEKIEAAKFNDDMEYQKRLKEVKRR